MKTNIENIAENQISIELMDKNSESLVNISSSFVDYSVELERKLWWRNMKLKIMIAAAVLVIVLYLTSGFWWGNSTGNGSINSDNSNPTEETDSAGVGGVGGSV